MLETSGKFKKFLVKKPGTRLGLATGSVWRKQSWHVMKTTSASVPAMSVIAVVHGRARAGSAGCADARPASSARSIRPYARRAATPIDWVGPEEDTAGSMRGAEAPR